MKKFFQQCFVLLFFCFSVLGFRVNAETIELFKNNKDEEQVLGVIESLLVDRANFITDEALQVRSVNIFKNRSANDLELEQRQAIVDFRNALANMGETYTDTETSLIVNSVDYVSENVILVNIKEETFMTLSNSDIQTGFSAEHQFVFELINNEWVLVEDRQLEPSGLMALVDAEKFVYESDEEVVIDESNESVFDFSEYSFLTEEIPASIDKDSLVVEEKNLNGKAGYNYTAMANYLEKYWSNYNSAYRSFTADCTNFASQALYAGGWASVDGWYLNANYWWYNSSNQTRSWVNVDYWATFARNSGRVTSLSNVWNLGVGDVLQAQASGSSSKDHTMMVSYRSGGTPYFTYHSSNRYRRSMNQVLLDWKGGTFYAYRT